MSATTPACVLVLEDRPTDRLYLTTLLGYRGYTILEAANGEEGLEAVRHRRPDLVLSDVLMPKMDGFEFVRRLRRMPGCATVPVIFYTATYHEDQARQLAEECGVIGVMIKPSEPDEILARVEAALATGQAGVDALGDEAFDRRHAQLTSEKLIEKVRDLEASERRMAALLKAGQLLMAERDPVTLLHKVCQISRQAMSAGQAMVALLTEDSRRFALVLTDGATPEAAAQMRGLQELPPPLRRVIDEKRTVRGRMTDGESEHLPHLLPVSAYLIAPIVTRDRILGVLAVTNKIGADEFSEADEQAAETLGIKAGLSYDNALLINQLRAQGEALLDRERTTDFALSAAGIGVYERWFAQEIVRASKGVHDLLDIPEGQSLLDISDALPPDERQRVLDLIAPAIASCGEFSFDMTFAPEGKPVRHIHARGQIEPDAHGAPKRLLSVLIDMTERRQLELQLRQAQKMEAIGQLAGGVAHDFNNLLTVIQGYARFLEESAHSEDQRHDAAAIARAGDRAVALTRQLLAFSRRQARDIATFDLNLLITEVAGMLRRLIGEHIKLTTVLGEQTGAIENDRGQIEQVVMNLVVNSRDAMPSGGAITLETSRVTDEAGSWVRLQVRDTGTGIDAETKERIFEPFFTTKPVGKGTGLGLATVFSIISQSRGRISVDSEPGRGTTFNILLPPADDAAPTTTAAAPKRLTGTERVLVVEDDEAIRVLLKTMLARAGYAVTHVSGATEALAQPLDRFDLIISDVLMPGGTGPELVAAVRARRPDIRVIYVSGYAPEITLDASGLDDRTVFLPKPFTAETLTQKVREVLDR
ncbi:MAG TPA: response regulator [Vicinamibacterales bacterium]|nr:response regulator [Vicinamibacterales bacterium]